MQTRNKITLKEQERQRCEVWTRVMGYYRPVSQFNRGKQSEFAQRQFFVETVQIPIAK
ncbi:MAG: anaerobic ribonucleoside-triphosphate reductase [Verrucomicrobia bacterium]|jgi:anaerobic ribonucleoside-triphosphate reductase|nr:anaerobic ribonucleoside-triphosphate reductase [Verrucomicrobiota bacterium]